MMYWVAKTWGMHLRVKGSFIFQTEKLNKHNTEGYRAQKYFFKMQTIKLYNCTLDKK